jgi:tetratricopeptide (TPR) repeat protein
VAVPVPQEAEQPPPKPQNDDKLFPKVNRDEFVVIAPNRNPAERLPVPVPPPAIKPFDPAAVRLDAAEADPKREAERRVKLGRAAFADGDYGRAAEHFAAATAADPAEPTTYFLHGQAHFASGQYRDAVARIRDGLARDPRWPQFPFAPAALYGDPKQFAAHLADLKKANADRPGQVTLEFLLGYQLWFGGEKAEADKLFRAAEKRLADPGPIALFKLP